MKKAAMIISICILSLLLSPAHVTAEDNSTDILFHVEDLIQAEQYDEALVCLNEFLENNPDSAEAYNLRGLVYFNLNNFDSAIEDFNHALTLNPYKLTYFINREMLNYYTESYTDALMNFFNSETISNSELALKYMNIIDPKLSTIRLKELNGMINENPRDIDALLERGLIHFWAKRYERAIANYKQVIGIDPQNYIALLYLGKSYCLISEHKISLEYYTLADKIERTPDTLNGIGHAYFGLGELQTAVDYYTMQIEMDPDFWCGFLDRGLALDWLGEFDRAVADFLKHLERHPNCEWALNWIASTYHRKKDYDKAIEYINKAIELYPNNGEHYLDRGITYSYLKNFDAEFRDFDKAIQLEPENTKYLHTRAEAYIYKGENNWDATARNRQLAFDDYARIIQLKPKETFAYMWRASAYGAIQDWYHAILDCNIAIELDAEDSKIWNNRGSYYYYSGNLNQAISDYNTALTLDPKNSGAWYARAIAYNDQGRYQEAYDDLVKSLEINPSRSKAIELLEQVKAKLGI